MDAERLVRVERRARRLRVLGDQLQVGEGGQRRHHEGQQERQPDDAAHRPGHGPGDRVDAGAQDVAHDEQEQELGPHDPFELVLVTFGSYVEHLI